METQLAKQIRAKLMLAPYEGSRILEHERMKAILFELGKSKGYIAQEEVNVEKGRIDLCWFDFAGKARATFEIESLHPKKKSLAKLRNLESQYKFIVLRRNALAFDKVGDIILIGLNRNPPRRFSLKRKNQRKTEGN